MKSLPENCSLLNKKGKRIAGKLCTLFFVFISLFHKGQIANYINNGGFELPPIGFSSPLLAKYWAAPDTIKQYGEVLSKNTNPYNVPLSGYTYQWPRHGNNFLISLQYCPSCGNHRGYPRNRLKNTLQQGKTYCVRFYVNLANESTNGTDALGAYFGDSTIDTISHCNDPIVYLSPQIQNPTNNIIVDTLGWTEIKGLFIANGTEKYMLLGNFKSDLNTNLTLTNPHYLPYNSCDYSFDDVSCIDIDLPAFAGNDNSVVPGDSIFLGREPDVGIDESCMWYKLPTVITPTTPAIDTVAGFWIKPVTTETYVVRQQLWCSSVKWDTVVIYMNPLGLEKLKLLNEELKIYPVPASDFLELRINNEELVKDFTSLSIYNNIGLLLREEEFFFKNKSFKIKLDDLPAGVYSLQLKSNKNETVSKRFVISR